MIRGRAGRARFITNPRATVRIYPPNEQEAPVRTSRKIDTPVDLLRICEEAGAEVRPTTNGGHMVYGPAGTANVPQRWTHGRGQANVIAQVRKTGLDLSAAEHAELARRSNTTDNSNGIPKLVTNGGRPTLTYDPPQPETPAPNTADKRPAAVSQKDFDDLLEIVDALTARVDQLARTVKKLERGNGGPTVQDRAREIRDRIEAWFRQLPPGMRVPAGVVTGNLCSDSDDSEIGTYRRQLTRMVELGQLQQHGGGAGRGGAAAQYSLPAPGLAEGGASDAR